jgi:lycopene cyclase domain-containing protein
MQLSYLRLNLSIIIIPLLLSFETRVRYVRYWPAVLFSILIVGTLYVIWDAFVTRRGDWSFNPDYLSGKIILGLPLEEVLFFGTAPFSCIFIYEVYRYMIPAFNVPYSRFLLSALGLTILALAYLFRYQNYTRTVLTVTGGTVLLLVIAAAPMISSGIFWLALFTSFIPFVIFNGYLTAIPIVRYNPAAIIGIRIGTIPIEDFFYNYAMLSSYFWVYFLAKEFLSL